MRNLLLLSLIVFLSACTQSDNLALYKTNLEVAKQALSCYETPADFETFKSLIHEDVKHQSPMYGQGLVDYDGVLGQAGFYMQGFTNVKFENAVWLPGVDSTSLSNDGSVRVYGTWSGESIETGNSFSVDSYHYFDVADGKITASGDYFDATGMVMAVSAPAPADEE
ncbi:MAG: nuclear transport factor 2 family protein [Flavobacteriales bacterium]